MNGLMKIIFLFQTLNDVNVSLEGTYSLVVTNNDNGCSATDDVLVDTDIDLPIADAGTAENLTCVVLDVILNGNGSSNGPNFSYEWQDENNDVISNDIQVSVSLPGTYT